MAPWTGSAGAQTFQRTDGTRTGDQTWAEADAAGVDIITTNHDTHDSDIADGLSACLKNDGGNSATSNIPMGGFNLKNLGQAIARTDSIRAGDVQNNRMSYCTVGGTANAITLTNTVPISTYAAGQEFRFQALLSNSDVVTIAVDGLAAKAVNVAGTPLGAGQIVAGAWIVVAYDGTDFEMAGGAIPTTVKVGSVMVWPVDTVPGGWLEADGTAVSRTTYSALFAVYSTKYGTGDGSTTFNLPNYKDEFLRGFDASGTDAASRTDRGDGTTGANVGTKQAADYKAHTHTASVTDPGHTHSYTGGTLTGNNQAGGPNPNFTSSGTTGSSTTGITVTNSTSPATGGTETRPKNITVKWIILALPSASIAVAQIAPYFIALTTDKTGTNDTSAQNVFADGASTFTLPGSTAYEFEALIYITRAAGTTSHTTSVLMGGTATYTSILYSIESTTTTGAPTSATASQQLVAAAATATVAASASTSATENIVIKLKGLMRINASGTVIPQFQYSAAPGGAPSIKANSYFKLIPLGSDTVASYGPVS